jgi:hypothetical protein
MRILHTLAALSALLPAALSVAQTAPIAPSSLSRYVSMPSLSAEDLAVIKAFIDREAPRLVSQSSTDAIQGRARLTADITSTTRRVSPIFLEEYTTILVPHLREMLEGDDTSAAVLAAQVTALLGTDGAVKLLSNHLDTRDEPRNAVRLWAVGGIEPLIASPNVSKARAVRALRAIERSARDEVSWPVHRRVFKALAMGIANERGEDAGQAAVRKISLELLAETTQSALDAIKGGRVQLINGLPVVTATLQSTLLRAGSPAEQAELVKVMVPVLAGGHEAVLAQWDDIRSNPRTLDAAARYLDESELILTMLTKKPARGGQLSKALRSDKRSDLESASKRWSQYRS